MRFAIAVHGTRGDIEPIAAVALELRDRGHEVRLAVPPNLVAFVEAAGLERPVVYGVDSAQQLNADAFRKYWKIRKPTTAFRELSDYITQGWAQMSETLTAMAHDADLILTGTTYQEVAANVAEHQDIPLAALHYFPARANTAVLPVPVPHRVADSMWAIAEWVHWRALKPAEDAQRRALGLPKTTVRAVRRIVCSGALEIQAYDEVLFPGLNAQWGPSRPLVGAMTLGLSTNEDPGTAAWIADGTPPIYFGFGSMLVDSPSDAIEMITDVCAELGERALICSGTWDLTDVPRAGRVRVVASLNHAAAFPQCRAVVHHGGAGTTAAGLRAAVPSLILWVGADQPIWGARIERLKAGRSLRFSKVNRESLLAALRDVLTRQCAARARDVSSRMTDPVTSVTTTADLLEGAARRGRVTLIR